MTGGLVVMLTAGAVMAGDGDGPPTLDQLLDLDQPAPAESSQAESNAEANADSHAASQDDSPADHGSHQAGDAAAGSEAADLARAAENDAAGVFGQAVEQMGEVSARMKRRHDAGPATQRQQKAILAKLDQVIAAARRRSASSDAKGGKKTNRRAGAGKGKMARQGRPGSKQSNASARRGGTSPDMVGVTAHGGVRTSPATQSALRETRRQWGALPPRLRNELSQGLHETFSPLYRDLTEQYYRRLAGPEQGAGGESARGGVDGGGRSGGGGGETPTSPPSDQRSSP